MMWAYSFDHARIALSNILRIGSNFLERGTEAEHIAIRQYQEEVDADLSPKRYVPPQDIVIGTVAAKIIFLRNRLQYDENQISDQSIDFAERYNYSVLELESNWLTIRAYRFDEATVTPQEFTDTLNQISGHVVFDNNLSSYPVDIRIFTDGYFAEITVFDAEHLEMRITSGRSQEELSKNIAQLIRILDSTRANR